MPMKPFLKWVGGKSQIINTIMDNYPKEINNYYEIFLGGGSTLLALLESNITISGKIYAYDINNDLINVYKDVQLRPHELYEKLEKLYDDYINIISNQINRNPNNKEEALTSKESYYYWIRNLYNTSIENIDKSAMFMFLNKTCFRGMYRIGPNGFNVPFGNYKKINIISKDLFLYISELITSVIFECLSFEQSMLSIDLSNDDDFVYLDPPYVPENSTSFVNYNADGFNKEQHIKLFKLCKKLAEHNINFMLSNSNTKLVLDEFSSDDFNIKFIECRRAINSKHPEQKTKEVIITIN
jgi:DNA adenine methylase